MPLWQHRLVANDQIFPVAENDDDVITDAAGRRARRSLVEHNDVIARRFYEVTDGVWCLVGNGLSNQTFIRGPEGIIAIDTGESVEEMSEALAELRAVTDEPIVEVLYTHFHYVSGTQAVVDEGAVKAIRGHRRIADNLARAGTEIAPAYGRGLVAQFGIRLPATGPDSLIGVGLGRFYRNPDHAPFTPGYVPATETFDDDVVLDVAGLETHVHPAPSDADDSVTFWFPSLGVAVNNIAWPALFNVFAIRGENYRDPQILLPGLDHLRSLGAEHLIGAHGPPISGAAEISRRLMADRDSIQYLWDQTVRWSNRGATSPELAHLIESPAEWSDDYLTQQHYGLAEHHVRQIRNGLFGFFDGDPAQLLPLPPTERADRMVDAMGGADSVADRCREALDEDLRWAIELASLLVARSEATPDDRVLLADALRVAARRTTSSNVRNWCLTTACDLDGTVDLSRFRQHRFSERVVAGWSVPDAVSILRVLVDPQELGGVDHHVAFVIDGERVGLHFRNRIACPTDGADADSTVSCTMPVWAALLAGKIDLDGAVGAGDVQLDGDVDATRSALACLDVPAFAATA